MKTDILGAAYRHMVKPILFKFPADKVHERTLHLGRRMGRCDVVKKGVEKIFSFENKKYLGQNICGMDFSNPIGLAAGFDYNADLVNILPSVGFGFHTVGTLTNLPYDGNKPPMLGRLPRSKSLLVNKGFKNKGLDDVLLHLPKEKTRVPYGISIGSTNRKYESFEDQILDIVQGFKKAEQNKTAGYYELNISCPNLENIASLPEKVDTPNGFRTLLEALSSLHIERPLFVKMPVEKDFVDIDSLIDTASDFSFIKGFIFANLVKNRNNDKLDREEVEKAGKGNFSGKPTFELSNKLIGHTYKKYGHRFIIIGCGGVFTGQDAYQKIKLGASLVQLVTGLVYMGPGQIGVINEELVQLLSKDGYKNISEAIGVEAI